MNLLKIGIWILAVLQLLFFIVVLCDPTALSMFVLAGFSPLFSFLTLILMLMLLRRIEQFQKKQEAEKIPKPPF